MSRLLIVDGHAYAYRAFHAIRELRSPCGEPTNAIYGFIKMLARMKAVLRPTHLAVMWDGGLSRERTMALPRYKAERPPMPSDLEKQLDGMVEYLEASGIASFCEDGVEADDLIASVAQRAFEADLEIVIASADKDFMQLVRPSVGLLNPNDKTEAVWTAEQVRAKTGVNPEQIVDWLSLIGDSVDNIPGVRGVGPKTAAELLGQFGGVDALYVRLAEVKSEKLRAALQSAEADVRRNQKLIRLQDNLPFDFSPVALMEQSPGGERLRVCFARWGFKSMLAGLESASLAQGMLI
jgi:DNA polymerase-1